MGPEDPEADSRVRAFRADHLFEHACAFRGEVDLAFEWLRKSYEWRDSGTVLARCDHLLGNLHPDPRWQPFLRKMNLADDQIE